MPNAVSSAVSTSPSPSPSPSIGRAAAIAASARPTSIGPVRRQRLAGEAPAHVGGTEPGAQAGADDGPGRRPDDQLGAAGIPAELVGQGAEHADVEGVTDHAAGPEDEGDRGSAVGIVTPPVCGDAAPLASRFGATGCPP